MKEQGPPAPELSIPYRVLRLPWGSVVPRESGCPHGAGGRGREGGEGGTREGGQRIWAQRRSLGAWVTVGVDTPASFGRGR